MGKKKKKTWMGVTFPEGGNVPKEGGIKYVSTTHSLWSGEVQR